MIEQQMPTVNLDKSLFSLYFRTYDGSGQIIVIHQPEINSHFGMIPLMIPLKQTMIPGFGGSTMSPSSSPAFGMRHSSSSRVKMLMVLAWIKSMMPWGGMGWEWEWIEGEELWEKSQFLPWFFVDMFLPWKAMVCRNSVPFIQFWDDKKWGISIKVWWGPCYQQNMEGIRWNIKFFMD